MYVPKASVKKISNLIDLRKSPEYILQVKKIVRIEFEKIKGRLIDNFERHKVTQEIEAGPTATNTSGTLGGYGNLFAYIGFEENAKPIEPIREQLSTIFIQSTTFDKNGASIVYVNYPTAKDIFNVTPLPWADGRSWAEGIEKGLPGLGFFLSKESSVSRSGGGIQTEKQIKKGKFRNTSYISSLIKDFERDIMKLNGLTI